jgi:YidC/Oxa1 family membrane protein insertase
LAEFKNPQQEPGMERKLLLVFALTFVVILLFQPLLKKYLPQPPAPKPEASQSQSSQTPQDQPPAPAAASAASGTSAAGKKVAAATTNRQAESESETVIENDLYKITFSNRGGRVKSWVLKKYKDKPNGQPLDLVNPAAADKYGYPLTLWTYDESLRNKVNSALYVATSTGTSGPGEITFEYTDGEVAVHKSYKFDHSYIVEVHTSVEVHGAPVSAFPMWASGFGDETNAAAYAAGQIAYQFDANVERLAMKKISGGGTVPGPFHWVGVSDQYFAAVLIPQDPRNAAMVTLRNPLEIPNKPSDPNDKQMDKVEVLGVAVGSLKGATSVRMFVGPKTLEALQAVQVPGITGAEPDLRGIVDFGWLGLIARPLFLWLRWTFKYVHNWGWAIVIQTIIINLALLPLRLSQMKSMLKMQRVAPQIKSIQEKYKKYSLRDPKKAEMNEEISALYKKEGVNPIGGCLPLLIQMPFLFAYYRMLGVAIDLRHATWLWVPDLSAPDPHWVLPIAIVVTMFFMQRMTPQAGMDPTQQKMMNFMMPAMLGYISFNLAAGLCLYWAMGQLIGIVQQWALNQSSLGREMREMMAKRARKKEK